ncbi:MAG: NAD(P)-dependent oxidoreductase [Polyangiaceae bacterium]
MIAFLGMGLLGSNFVRALRKRGEDVQVWNRSPEKAQPLAETGAKVCATPADACKGASQIHVTLSDDAAVDDVLEKAKAGFDKGAVIVDHTTTSPIGTLARSKKWIVAGFGFQHAPVFMGPKNALESTGIMLASGDKSQFDALAPFLEKMTGKLAYLGPAADRAAAIKLMGNLFLVTMITGLSDTLALAKAEGVPNEEVAALFELFNPGAMVGGRLKVLMRGNFSEPSWELAMARKDTRLMIEAAERGGTHLVTTPAIAKEMDRWIEKGHAKDDWTVIAKDVVSK